MNAFDLSPPTAQHDVFTGDDNVFYKNIFEASQSTLSQAPSISSPFSLPTSYQYRPDREQKKSLGTFVCDVWKGIVKPGIGFEFGRSKIAGSKSKPFRLKFGVTQGVHYDESNKSTIKSYADIELRIPKLLAAALAGSSLVTGATTWIGKIHGLLAQTQQEKEQIMSFWHNIPNLLGAVTAFSFTQPSVEGVKIKLMFPVKKCLNIFGCDSDLRMAFTLDGMRHRVSNKLSWCFSNSVTYGTNVNTFGSGQAPHFSTGIKTYFQPAQNISTTAKNKMMRASKIFLKQSEFEFAGKANFQNLHFMKNILRSLKPTSEQQAQELFYAVR